MIVLWSNIFNIDTTVIKVIMNDFLLGHSYKLNFIGSWKGP